jgi:hypothetical protein
MDCCRMTGLLVMFGACRSGVSIVNRGLRSGRPAYSTWISAKS